MLTPAQTQDELRRVTGKFNALLPLSQSITIINGPLVIIGQGPFPPIIASFTDILTTVTTLLAQHQGTEPSKDEEESKRLLISVVTLVATAQQEFNTLIGKAGLFNTVPFIGQPLAAVLRQVESVFDTLFFALIDNYPTVAADLQTQSESFNTTLTQTINSYDGLTTVS